MQSNNDVSASLPASDVNSGTSSTSAVSSGKSAGEFEFSGSESLSDAFERFTGDSSPPSEDETIDSTKDEDETADANAEESSEVDAGDRKPEEKELEVPKESAGVKRRIDGLLSRIKEEQSQRKEVALENAKLREAARILQEELEYVRQRAQLDPREEEIRALKYDREIADLDREIPTRIESEFAELESKNYVEQQKEELRHQVFEVASQYDGLISAPELARYMAENKVYDVEQAAKKLADVRLQAAQKRLKVPTAPRTVTATSGTKSKAEPWRYKGTDSILDFFEENERSRNGI
jgi:hypothetical protein